jgi:SAM-dependent methyltransferase
VTDQRAFWESGGIYRPSSHPVGALFARQRIEYLGGLGLLADVRTVLDVGGGSGLSSAYYPSGVRVVACDYAAGMLGTNPVRDKLRCAADRLPFADRSFDLVTCWELLHHLDDPVATIREMLRVTRRRIVMFEPNRINPGQLWLGITRTEERATLRFSPGHIRRLVRRAGGALRQHMRCGLLFPNITPLGVARLLARLPYRVPLIAISQLVVVERADAPAR